MEQVQDRFEAPRTLSANQLVILVPKGNPHGIETLADLGKPGLRRALAPPGARPAGTEARANGPPDFFPAGLQQGVSGFWSLSPNDLLAPLHQQDPHLASCLSLLARERQAARTRAVSMPRAVRRSREAIAPWANLGKKFFAICENFLW